MKAYSAYECFGELWIDRIPSHWNSRKIKYLFKERSEKGYPDEPLLVASQNMGVVPKTVYGLRTVEAMKDLHLLKLVNVGDFVISLRSFQGGIEYAYYKGIISPAYTIMIPSVMIQSEYFRYLGKSARFLELLKLCVTGIREGQNIDYFKLKNHMIPLPPRPEQDQIVRFLDWKVSEINKLIGIKRKQIKLLDERRETRISDLIYGRNQGGEKKQIEGLGMISVPANWTVYQNKRLFVERVEHSETGTECLLSISRHYGVKPYDEVGETENYATIKPALSLIGYKKVMKEDLAMNIMRAQNGSYGISEYDGIVSAAYCVYKPIRSFNRKYIHYLYKTPEMISLFYANSYGIAEHRRRLYADRFLRMLTPLPPIGIQDEIVELVKKTDKQCREEARVLEKQITVLQELKTRLISDAVTGKIDVRDIVIPDYEYVEELSDEPEEDEPLPDEED